MGYAIRLARKTTELHPEEIEVRESLREVCTFDAPDTSFCPTRVLHEEYMRHRGDAPGALNPTQFGVALRRAFNLGPERKTRRLYCGRKEVGYSGVGGELSARTYDRPGNPNWRGKDAA